MRYKLIVNEGVINNRVEQTFSSNNDKNAKLQAKSKLKELEAYQKIYSVKLTNLDTSLFLWNFEIK